MNKMAIRTCVRRRLGFSAAFTARLTPFTNRMTMPRTEPSVSTEKSTLRRLKLRRRLSFTQRNPSDLLASVRASARRDHAARRTRRAYAPTLAKKDAIFYRENVHELSFHATRPLYRPFGDWRSRSGRILGVADLARPRQFRHRYRVDSGAPGCQNHRGSQSPLHRRHGKSGHSFPAH